MPRKPAEAPDRLSTMQCPTCASHKPSPDPKCHRCNGTGEIDALDYHLECIAILRGQLAKHEGIVNKQIQHYGQVEGRGFVGDCRQSLYLRPVWSKLAALTLACRPSPEILAKLLELLYSSIPNRSFRGFQAKLKDALPELQRDLFHRLDEADEHGGQRLYAGSASIAVRKSGATVMSSDPREASEGTRLIELGDKAWTDKELAPEYTTEKDPDEEEEAANIFVDGANMGISDDGYEGEDAA